jgi:hypothetical protein
MADHHKPGCPTFDGVIDGGTGRFSSTHGSFHATNLPDSNVVQLTITLREDDR